MYPMNVQSDGRIIDVHYYLNRLMYVYLYDAQRITFLFFTFKKSSLYEEQLHTLFVFADVS